MFSVYGDDIVLENVTVGKLTGGWPTLRQRAIDTLEGTLEGWVREEGYKEGELDASEGRDRDIDAAESQGLRDGFKQGIEHAKEEARKQALVECAHAVDVERIALLLASCNKTYAILSAALAKNKPKSNLTEMRNAARQALMELRDAAVARNKDA
jgi:hypothetical protein